MIARFFCVAATAAFFSLSAIAQHEPGLCLQAVARQYEPLTSKLAATRPLNSITLQELANKARPTEEERAKLGEWYEARKPCIEEAGRNYRQNAPAITPVFEWREIEFTKNLSKLFSGDFTFGEYLTELRRLVAEANERAVVAQQKYAGEIAANHQNAIQRQAAQRQQSSEFVDGLILLNAAKSRPPGFAPSLNCTSRQFGSQVQTQCN